jgi:APA family basic amino acid/polyamine antiporter
MVAAYAVAMCVEAVSPRSPRRQLSLFDSVCILVGIVIGAGIFETTPMIAANVAGLLPDTAATSTLALDAVMRSQQEWGPWLLIATWLMGGGLALVGALCYAELATIFPETGGDYVFLSKAFGRYTGFAFAWVEFWIVRPGNVGALAYVFGRYAQQLQPLGAVWFGSMAYSVIAVVFLTAVNMSGLHSSKHTQNALTVVKVVGLLVIILTGLFFLTPAPISTPAPSNSPGSFTLAMILVIFTFGGWNDMTLVSAEVQHPRRNLLRALVWGAGIVTVVYILVNVAMVRVLSFSGVGASTAVASDVMQLAIGRSGAVTISLLICVSCLGAINGMIFTGSRIFYAIGTQHRVFHWLGHWNAKCDAPLRSLVLQAGVTVGLIVGFGWYADGFQRLVVFTAPFFFFFLLLVGLALFVFRIRSPPPPEAYRVILFPLTPILFCVTSAAMLYCSSRYAWSNMSQEFSWSIAVIAVGAVLAMWDQWNSRREPPGG